MHDNVCVYVGIDFCCVYVDQNRDMWYIKNRVDSNINPLKLVIVEKQCLLNKGDVLRILTPPPPLAAFLETPCQRPRDFLAPPFSNRN